MPKHWRSLLLLIALLGSSLACNLPSSAPSAAPTNPPPTRIVEIHPPPASGLTPIPPQITPGGTPECPGHASNLILVASNATPIISETLLLTATLTNVGDCGMIGLPRYTLRFDSDVPGPILQPDPPEPVTHSRGLNPGDSDIITYTLQVVGAGVITINISASFEVHLGYPGPAYWAGDSSQPLTITIQPSP